MPSNHVEFTREMREAGYTILVPNMLEFHFSLIVKVLRLNGYNAELLTNSGPNVMAEGLKYVHNDTCVPALLVIGQFLDALHSGKYDINKVALIITQTGGGCRASNYIYLLRKALKKAGLEQVPVISVNMSGPCRWCARSSRRWSTATASCASPTRRAPTSWKRARPTR